MRSNSLYMWQLVSCNICLLLTITSSIFFLQYITPEEKLGQQHSRSNIMHIWDISPHHQNFAYQLIFLRPGRQHYCLERNSWIQILRIYRHKLEPNPKHSYNDPSLLSKSLRFFFFHFFWGQQVTKIEHMCIRASSSLFFPPSLSISFSSRYLLSPIEPWTAGSHAWPLISYRRWRLGPALHHPSWLARILGHSYWLIPTLQNSSGILPLR